MARKIRLHDSSARQQREAEKQHRFSTVERGWGKGLVDHPILNRKMLSPYFWGTWIFLFFFKWLIILLPYPVLMFLGKTLGKLLGNIIPSRKYVLKRNLELAFPDLDEEARRKLRHEILTNSGMAAFETGIAWYWSDRRFLKHVRIDEDELKKAKELAATNCPVLVMTCHFVTLEIMARAYALLIKPGIGVYRPSDHPVWEYAQVKGRLRNNLALVDRRDPRSMIKALMRGYPIWYAPDQDYGRRVSVFAPFFAVKEAATVTGTHDLARVKGCKVQPSFTVREGSYYHLYVREPLKDFPTEDVMADTAYCNRIIEDMIKMAPGQYLWLHRRFKTAPEGQPGRYPKIK